MYNDKYAQLKTVHDIQVGNTFTHSNGFPFIINSINELHDNVVVQTDGVPSEISLDYLKYGYSNDEYTVIQSPENSNKFKRAIQLQQSLEYHLNNKYPDKIPNISLDGVNGALNKALNKEYGIKLNKEELISVHNEVKAQKKSLGISS